MKKKRLKKGSAILLSVAMVLSLFPEINGSMQTVQAATSTEPTSGYWTDATGLKGFSLDEAGDTVGKIKFGANDRLWAICGADGDNLALLSTSEFAEDAYGSTSEYSNSNFVHKLTTNYDDYLSTTYFSTGETGKMAEVTVATNEPDTVNGGNHPIPVEDKKLYLPNSQKQTSYGTSVTTIYVGSSNDIDIDVTKLTDVNGFQTKYFWLRSPYGSNSINALVALPGDNVLYDVVNDYFVSVVPAFNLNLSSDIFASAAEAASSSYRGYKANIEMTENTFTLRYTYTDGTDSAVINPSGTQVKVTNANNKYLMVQNSTGVYALAIGSNDATVNASDIQMGDNAADKLDNFNNCKVWIESTNEDRITTAKMATQETATVTITAGANMTKTAESGAANQTGITGNMADVLYTADSGYYFPSDYSVEVVNDVTVTRVDASTIKVSGTPTAANIVITLTAATEKGTADTPAIGIDYVNEELTGFDTAKKYSINGGVEFSPVASTVAIDNSYFGSTITIKETESDTKKESANQSLEIARPAMPSVTGQNESVDGKGDGSITGVDSTMEYSTNQTNWTTCEENTISNLTAGTYYIRRAATNTSFKSNNATVTINPGVAKKIALTVTAPAFTSETEGYTRPAAQSITIANDTTNGANWDATVSGVTLTGTDAVSFAVSGSGNDWTVQPIVGLTANENGTAKTYTATINVAYDATTGVTSPATADITFTVNPKSNAVTVTNGTGSNTYNKGTTVTATANATSEGFSFKEWTGINGLSLVDGTTSTSETIKFIMPENEVNISATYKDIAAPTAEITVGTNHWNTFLNTITFGYFFKNTKEVTITGTDGETSVAKREYYLADRELTSEEVTALTTNSSWVEYSHSFNIAANSKKIIYAKVTDEADNYVVVNSDGIVVYVDSAQATTSITHIKNVSGAQTADVTLNGNTVKAINDESKTLSAGTDYSVSGGTITFTESYLESLAVRDAAYTLTIRYNPMGETGTPSADSDTPATTTLDISVIKPKLTNIPAVPAVTGVANGTDKTALGLPTTVTIATEDSTVTTADVTWKVNELTDREYNKNVLTEQTFTVNGTVTLPDTIDQNDKNLDVTISVTVSEAGITGAPNVSVPSGTYTSNQSIILTSTTEGAKIYYTLDGSEPTENNGMLYTKAIDLTGEAAKSKDFTLKTVAEKDNMYPSEVITFTYTINLPLVEYPYLEGSNSSDTISQDESYSVRVDCEYSKFESVEMDGTLVDAKNYSVKSGSTIITFASSYMDALSVGGHTLRVNFTDGYAITKLTVAQKQPSESDDSDKTPSTDVSKPEDITTDPTNGTTDLTSPDTGDHTPIGLYVLLMLLGGTGIGVSLKKRNRSGVKKQK